MEFNLNTLGYKTTNDLLDHMGAQSVMRIVPLGSSSTIQDPNWLLQISWFLDHFVLIHNNTNNADQNWNNQDKAATLIHSHSGSLNEEAIYVGYAIQAALFKEATGERLGEASTERPPHLGLYSEAASDMHADWGNLIEAASMIIISFSF